MTTTNPLPQLNISLYQGDDETAIIEVIDERGKYADFNGYRIDADCYDVITDELVWHLSSKTGEITTAKGRIFIHIPHHYTEKAEWEKLAFDLQLTDPNGKIKTIAQGVFSLENDITQAYGQN